MYIVLNIQTNIKDFFNRKTKVIHTENDEKSLKNQGFLCFCYQNVETHARVNIITAVKILEEIGDINRFKSAGKLAQFAGIAPLTLSSAGKGKGGATRQGNQRLQATIYFLAVQMVQMSSGGIPRNPEFRAYYERRSLEGKNGSQILICISRRLINIIYGMLKNGTEYRTSEEKKEHNSGKKK